MRVQWVSQDVRWRFLVLTLLILQVILPFRWLHCIWIQRLCSVKWGDKSLFIFINKNNYFSFFIKIMRYINSTTYFLVMFSCYKIPSLNYFYQSHNHHYFFKHQSTIQFLKNIQIYSESLTKIFKSKSWLGYFNFISWFSWLTSGLHYERALIYCNFTLCFIWVSILVSHHIGRTQTEAIWKQGPNENMWA